MFVSLYVLVNIFYIYQNRNENLIRSISCEIQSNMEDLQKKLRHQITQLSKNMLKVSKIVQEILMPRHISIKFSFYLTIFSNLVEIK